MQVLQIRQKIKNPTNWVTKTITREYPVEVPAYNIATMKLTLYKYDMDVDYIATCVGKISGKEIKIKGRW